MMRHGIGTLTNGALALTGVLVLAALGGAELTGTSIPLAPHGDSVKSNAGEVVPLTPRTALVATRGPDNEWVTDDDRHLLLGDLDEGAASATLLAAPFGPENGSGPTTRMSATRALTIGFGDDGTRYTADDVVYRLDGLGTENTVTPIVVGAHYSYGYGVPIKLSASSAAIPTMGSDLTGETADDQITLLTSVGDLDTVTNLPAPNLFEVPCRPAPLSPTSFLLPSKGPDGSMPTADDVIYLFTDVGGTNARVDLVTPNIPHRRAGVPERLSATRAVVVSAGEDRALPNADDGLYVLDDLGGANSVTFVPLPGLPRQGSGAVTALSEDLAVVMSTGDGLDLLPALVVISDVGGTNTLTRVDVGPFGQQLPARPVRLSSSSVALVTHGPDERSRTVDDSITVVSDVGGANTVTHIQVGGMAMESQYVLTVVSSTALLFVSDGVDLTPGGGDDQIVLLSDIPGTPTTDVLALIGGITQYGASQRLRVLGGGRAAMVEGGPDGVLGDGGDDVVRIVDGIPRDRDLVATKIKIKRKADKPEKPAKVSAKARLILDTPDLFTSADVTVSIGNAAQTIAASAFKTNRKGVVSYKDKKATSGFITSLVYHPKKGTLTVKGKGLGTGLESTAADFIPFTVEVAEIYVADAVTGDVVRSGIRFKVPRR